MTKSFSPEAERGVAEGSGPVGGGDAVLWLPPAVGQPSEPLCRRRVSRNLRETRVVLIRGFGPGGTPKGDPLVGHTLA